MQEGKKEGKEWEGVGMSGDTVFSVVETERDYTYTH